MHAIEDQPETPTRPADAFFAMQAILPPVYFAIPPVPGSVVVHVTGKDKIRTQWLLPRDFVPQVRDRLAGSAFAVAPAR